MQDIERTESGIIGSGPLPFTAEAVTARPDPLSFAQERLWFIQQHLSGHETAYNMPMAWRMTGPLDLEVCAPRLPAGAPARNLRTTFRVVAAGLPEPVQVVADTVPVEIPLVDIQPDELETRLATHARQVFDLSGGPLLKVTVLRLKPTRHVLLLNLHHIVCDGWSIGVDAMGAAAVLCGSGHQCRTALATPADPIRRLCMLAAQAGPARAFALLGAGFGRVRGRFEATLRSPAPARSALASGWYPIHLSTGSGEARHALQPRAAEHVVHDAAQRTVCGIEPLTGRTDLCIGTTVSGRDFLQLEGLIGFFIGILPLRLDLAGDPTSIQLLQRVKAVALEGYGHQGLPFEHLLNAMRLQRHSGQTPLVPVMARHQNFSEAPVHDWAGELDADF